MRVVGSGKRRNMARRNRNTFMKRQKEMQRVQKAREKMARRHGKVSSESAGDAEERSPEAGISCASLAEGVNGPNLEGLV